MIEARLWIIIAMIITTIIMGWNASVRRTLDINEIWKQDDACAVRRSSAWHS